MSFKNSVSEKKCLLKILSLKKNVREKSVSEKSGSEKKCLGKIVSLNKSLSETNVRD